MSRRRGSSRAALVALVLAPLAVAGAVLFALDDRSGGSRITLPFAAGGAGASAGAQERHEAKPPAIDLTGVDAFHLRLRRPPRAGLVFDVRTGEVLWRLHPERVLPIASLTKIMTALVVTQRTEPNERVKITRSAAKTGGSAIGILPRGRNVRLETLFNGLLLVSANDAAIALAQHVAGRERRFVGLMNARANQLGLRCSHFVSPHGLEVGNRSCARDLAVMTRLALRQPRIRRIARRSQVAFRFPIKGHRLFLAGHNPLIRAGYPGAIGLKTGFTDPAGRCFVGVAKRRGRTLAVVLLHSRNPLKHASRLLDLGFGARR